MQSVFGVSLGAAMFAVAIVVMLYGAIGMWMQSEKTRADAVASGALLVFVPVVGLQSVVGEALSEWASLALGVLAVACMLALCWAIFVEGLSHNRKREQEVVDRIEALIEAANKTEEDGER